MSKPVEGTLRRDNSLIVTAVRNVAYPASVFIAWRAAHLIITLLSGSSLTKATLRWDGAYYLSIAKDGYFLSPGGYDQFQNVAFFPAVPWLTKPFLLLGDDLATVIVANSLALVAFLGVYFATETVFDRRCARAALVTLAVWPGSLWLWAYYSEAALVAASAWAIQRDRVGASRTAIALTFVAALTRLVGVLLGPILALSRFSRTRKVDRVIVGYLVSSLTGLALVAAVQWRQVGDALAFQRSHQAWGRSMSWPWTPLVSGLNDIIEQPFGIAAQAALDIACILIVMLAGLWMLVHEIRTRRFDTEPLALWAVGAGALPLFSRLVGSMTRFSVTAWSAFALLGSQLVRSSRLVRFGFWLAAATASLLSARRLGHGVFVG